MALPFLGEELPVEGKVELLRELLLHFCSYLLITSFESIWHIVVWAAGERHQRLGELKRSHPVRIVVESELSRTRCCA